MITLLGGKLLLPEPLWSRLDETSRRTILCHELAHLARRDHWVRIFTLMVGTVFWWHPVVWWARRNLAEEAEHCCDAWVTWHMSAATDRRAYARALLTTSEFISTAGVPTPALGIGVSTVRAKRLARRLTMVMTQTSQPRLSLSGVVLLSVLTLVGWLATPAWSKPTTPAPAPPGQPAPPASEVSPIPPVAPIAPAPAIAPVEAPRPGGLLHAGTALVQSLIGDEAAVMEHEIDDEEDEDDENDPDEDLEARIDRLERRLEELTGLAPRAPRASVTAPRAAWGGEKVAREYRLPKGKLEALLALMSRQDVPILVQGGGDVIIVQATPGQHEVFAAFVRMIDPKDGEAAPQPRAGGTPGARGLGTSRAPAARVTPAPDTPKVRTMIRDRLGAAQREATEMLHQQRIELEAAAARLRDKAAEIRDKAEAAIDNEVKQELRREADALRRKAQELAREVKGLSKTQRQKEREARDLEREMKRKRTAVGETSGDDGDDDAAGAADAYQKGYQLHMDGQFDEAIELFKQAAAAGHSQGPSLYNVACGYSRMGNKDKAFEYLEKAWAAGYREADHMRQDEDLDNIRNDKRFEEIVGGTGDDSDEEDEDD
jgi:hypothetical protein